MKVGDLVTCIYEKGVGVIVKNLGRRQYLVYWPSGICRRYWSGVCSKVGNEI